MAQTVPARHFATRLAPAEATRRWAARLPQIFEIDPLTCPICHGAMRVVAFITQASVIGQILAHLRTRAAAGAPTDRAPRGSTRPEGAAGCPGPRLTRRGRAACPRVRHRVPARRR